MAENNKNTKWIWISLIFLSALYLSWKYNDKLFFVINGFYSTVLAYPMIFMTAMADGLFVLMISAAAYSRKRGYYWVFILAYIISTLIVHAIKNSYPSKRPLAYYPIEQLYYAGEILKFQSFPSGHSAAALVLSSYMAHGRGKYAIMLIYALGISAAVSRVYIGVHFPLDVVAGSMIGFLTTHIVFYYAEKRNRHQSRPEYKYNEILISLTGLTSAVMYLFFNNDMYQPLSYFINIVALFFTLFFITRLTMLFLNVYRNKENAQ